MRRLFVDTLYFVALINLNDQWREKALRVKSEIFNAKFITTEIVLIEVLNFFSEYGENLRRQVSFFVRDVLEDVDFDVISYTETTLLEGLELYESRLDKGYSLSDCISLERSAVNSELRKFSRMTIILSRFKLLRLVRRAF